MPSRSPSEILGQPYALLVYTQHGSVTAHTAIHRHAYHRRIGGARFRTEGGWAEAGDLAAAMTYKCGANFLPADGQKSVITCPDGIPLRDEEKATILIAHAEEAARLDPGVIFGPDMDNGEPVMDLLAEAPGLLDHATGLSRSHGGVAIDTQGYTAIGLVQAVLAAGAHLDARPQVATVQGFGAVGAHAARLLAAEGIVVPAVSNLRGTLRARGGDGLDIPALVALWTTLGDDGLAAYAADNPSRAEFVADRAVLFTIPTDIFVPAAGISALATSSELAMIRASKNPDALDVADFLRDTGVRVIAQGANCPLTPAAEAVADAAGVVNLPDFLVNSGGLVGCWFEWAWRSELRTQAPGVFDRVDARARSFLRSIMASNVSRLLSLRGSSRAAAYRIADENGERTRADLADLETGNPVVDHQRYLDAVVARG